MTRHMMMNSCYLGFDKICDSSNSIFSRVKLPDQLGDGDVGNAPLQALDIGLTGSMFYDGLKEQSRGQDFVYAKWQKYVCY